MSRLECDIYFPCSPFYANEALQYMSELSRQHLVTRIQLVHLKCPILSSSTPTPTITTQDIIAISIRFSLDAHAIPQINLRQPSRLLRIDDLPAVVGMWSQRKPLHVQTPPRILCDPTFYDSILQSCSQADLSPVSLIPLPIGTVFIDPIS